MDDYAHHPSEIAATLKAVRSIYPERRLVVVYQPHRFSRTAKFAPDIARALEKADKSYVLPVYSAGEDMLPHSSSQEILKHGAGKIEAVNFDAVSEILKSAVKPGDILLTMGAGNVYELGENFVNENQNL